MQIGAPIRVRRNQIFGRPGQLQRAALEMRPINIPILPLARLFFVSGWMPLHPKVFV